MRNRETRNGQKHWNIGALKGFDGNVLPNCKGAKNGAKTGDIGCVEVRMVCQVDMRKALTEKRARDL